MRSLSNFWWCFAVGASCMIVRSPLARADGGEPVRLDYHAPASCPDEAALLSRIRARVEVREAVGSEAARGFTFTITVQPNRVIGTITSITAEGEPSARALSGSDCAEVVDALALVAAMDLHPELELGASASAGSDSPPAPPAALVPPPAAAPAPSLGLSSSLKLAGPVQHAESKPKRFRWLGSGQAELNLGYVPNALLGEAVRLELLDGTGRALRSSYAVGVSSMGPTRRSIAEGDATLMWTLGQLSSCPIAFSRWRSIALMPCARLDLGRLNAIGGGGVQAARTRNLVWFDAGIVGRILWMPAGPLVVDGQLAAVVPLTSYEFDFQSGSVVYGAPRLGFSTSIGLGVLFL